MATIFIITSAKITSNINFTSNIVDSTIFINNASNNSNISRIIAKNNNSSIINATHIIIAKNSIINAIMPVFLINVAHFTRIKAVYKKAVVLFGQHKVKQAACVFI